MDEGRKKPSGSALRFSRLLDLPRWKMESRMRFRRKITYDAICKAERIIRQIDLRWLGECCARENLERLRFVCPQCEHDSM
jgi:hypothetical protein